MRVLKIVIIALAVSCPFLVQAEGESDTTLNVASQVPQNWTYDSHFDQTLPTEDAWWKQFGDTVLDALIAQGLDYNYNLSMAQRRIEMARRTIDFTRSAYFPTVGAQAGWNGSRISGMNGKNPGNAVESDYFSAGLNVNWEIDVFGRISKRAERDKANLNVSRAEYAGAQVSLAANIASAYITLRTYQAQLAVAEEHIASQRHIVEMTEARHEAGLASMLDVTQAKVVLYSTQASIPGLKAAIESTINSIAVLTGDFPGQLKADLMKPGELPGEFHNVGIGVPTELLRRRPDVLEAESRLAADAAAIGISKKDFLPTLSLTGSIGTSAHKVGDLFTKESFTYSIAPTLTWTVFSGMSRRYSEQQAREQMMADIDNYNFTVQTAVEEVDNAIITYAGTLENIGMLDKVIIEARKSLELSVDLYRNSLSSFSNVVDAQMNYLTYQNSLVAAKGKALQSLVNLYKALGGGWTL